MFSFYLISAGTNLMASLWLSAWTADSNYAKNSETFYISGYALTALLMGIVTFIRTFILTRFGIRSAGRLHGNVLRSVLRAPMSFFDTTPTGRILSRFSKDMFTVDQELAGETSSFSTNSTITSLTSFPSFLFFSFQIWLISFYI